MDLTLAVPVTVTLALYYGALFIWTVVLAKREVRAAMRRGDTHEAGEVEIRLRLPVMWLLIASAIPVLVILGLARYG